MQGYQVFGPIGFNMVLDTNIVVKLIRFLQDKFPFPFHIEVGPFAEGPDGNFRLVIAGDCLKAKCLILELYLIHFCAFDQLNSILPCDFGEYCIEFIPADPKSTQRKTLLKLLSIRCGNQ